MLAVSVVLNRRARSRCLLKPVASQASQEKVWSIVLKCFDILWYRRGSGTVDKIKKYRRDSPSGVFTHLARRELRRPTGSVIPDHLVCKNSLGNPSRYSLV